jgi:hypothetical protein
MSTNGNGWKPSKIEPYKCADGSTVYVHRPGPELALRVGRIPRTFTKSVGDDGEKLSPEERLAQMSDEEQDATVQLAREVIVAMVASPKLTLNPREGELGPDDTGADFWPLFAYAMDNYFKIKVPVGEGEVEAEDLATFRPESGVPADSVDSTHIPVAESERTNADQGLVGGAGA